MKIKQRPGSISRPFSIHLKYEIQHDFCELNKPYYCLELFSGGQ